MFDSRSISILAILLGALSLWLMLPRGAARGRGIGVVVGVVALGLGMSQLPWLGQWLADGLFFVLAGVAVLSAIGAITFRDPIYCAIWFGLSLLGVAGLFLFVGAQFLAVATIVVYAGAILVTFLFMLMLAQPEGRASYDRRSSEPSISVLAGTIMVGVLSMAIGGAILPCARGEGFLHPPSDESLAANVLAPRHVARLGGELFGRHLIAVEIAGTLLLVALIGAAVIVGRGEERGARVEGPGARD